MENGAPFPSSVKIGYITSPDFELLVHGAPREGAPERPLVEKVLLDFNFADEVAHGTASPIRASQSTESQFVEGEQQSFARFAPIRHFDESPEYPSDESGGRKLDNFMDSSSMCQAGWLMPAPSVASSARDESNLTVCLEVARYPSPESEGSFVPTPPSSRAFVDLFKQKEIGAPTNEFLGLDDGGGKQPARGRPLENARDPVGPQLLDAGLTVFEQSDKATLSDMSCESFFDSDKEDVDEHLPIARFFNDGSWYAGRVVSTSKEAETGHKLYQVIYYSDGQDDDFYQDEYETARSNYESLQGSGILIGDPTSEVDGRRELDSNEGVSGNADVIPFILPNGRPCKHCLKAILNHGHRCHIPSHEDNESIDDYGDDDVAVDDDDDGTEKSIA